MNNFINSCLNYTGNKYRLLPQLFPLFPNSFDNFIDLFTGGAVVGVNVAHQYKIFNQNSHFILNDREKRVMDLFKYMKKTDISTFLKSTEKLITTYGLSNTKENGYDYYGVDSSKGLSIYNKKPYMELRKDFNSGHFNKNEEHVAFYVLIVFGFNNQIRFNKKGEYNLPSGKRDFNSNMESKLITFMKKLKEHEFEFHSKDFREIKQYKKHDFIYADPPYRITTATYNENGGWKLKDDLDLFRYLDKVNEKGAKFALSNVLTHKGQTNEELKSWAQDYNMHILTGNYNHSNYQTTAKDGKTTEVLITNY